MKDGWMDGGREEQKAGRQVRVEKRSLLLLVIIRVF